MAKPDILILDPGNYTPYYDINLSGELIRQGWNVEWVTSRYLFESIPTPRELKTDILFFRDLSGAMARLPVLRQTTTLRQLGKALSYSFELLRLDQKLARRAPGILHAQWALLPFVDKFFWGRWQVRGWKIIYTAHDVSGLEGTTPRILKNANRQLFHSADAVITHSQRDREKIIELGLASERAHYVPQGGPGIFQSRDLTREQARAELGIDAKRPVILFFGLLKPYKGLEILLASIARAKEKTPNILALIAGEALMPIDRYRKMIRELGLENNVRWELGYIPHNRVSAYFAAANMVALPYLAASSSAVLLNAHFHARPVVATRVGGLTEMVEPGETGLLVPPADSQALADTLTELALNPAHADAMGAQAQVRALSRHSWERIAQMTGEVYRNA